MPSKDSIVPVAAEADVTEAQVYAAIANVLDPELDEPLVKLGFIDHVQVEGADVTVIFKLPTFWCAPNFAYLMAGDLRAAILALPQVRSVRVLLLDHFAEDEINQGINGGKAFEEAFPGEIPEGEDLEALRRIFLRKGFLMRQDTLLRHMLKAKLDENTIINLRVADLIADESDDIAYVATSQGMIRLDRMGKQASAYLRKRKILGLSLAALLITDDQGEPVAPGSLQAFMRRSRSIRLNIAFNTTFCTGMFRTRYENAGALEAHREGENL
jgi:metal-sulfur cluster biosynthetic enzyme